MLGLPRDDEHERKIEPGAKFAAIRSHWLGFLAL